MYWGALEDIELLNVEQNQRPKRFCGCIPVDFLAFHSTHWLTSLLLDLSLSPLTIVLIFLLLQPLSRRFKRSGSWHGGLEFHFLYSL